MTKKKPLTTDEVKREKIESKPEPLSPGPRTGGPLEPNLSPMQYAVKNALPEEWADFAARVRDRVSREPREVWERCDKCGLVMPRKFRAAPGGRCIKCNYEGYASGGFFKPMSADEVARYQAEKKLKDAEAVERARKADFYRTNENRARQGLSPLTWASFLAFRREGVKAHVRYQARQAERT